MDVSSVNAALQRGDLAAPGLLPHLDALQTSSFVFGFDFGLRELPNEPGMILVRGPRQYGKSTWLEGELRRTVEQFGAGTAYYLNGDSLLGVDTMVAAIRDLLPMFRLDAPVRRLFLDEVTAVAGWERGLKLLFDAGELRDVLVVTTGSRATDLRRGVERLPGRKGRLDRTSYLFTPMSYGEFVRVCGAALGADALPGYLITGGCPLAAAELAAHGRLPEFVVELARDWVFGECAAGGRDRSSLLAVWDVLLRRGGSPIGQAGIAREAGLANNTVAAGYLQLLADLMCVGTAFAWDADKQIAVRRRPAKFPPTNLLAAVAFDRSRMRSVGDFKALPPEQQGTWLEWLVAQEIWRRAARRGEPVPDELLYWRGGDREIDFVVRPDLLLEVKRGGTSAMEFGWFPRALPHRRLWIVGADRFETAALRGLTIEDLLLDESW